jgi:transglutaminase-like putative cysteine protease
VSDQNSSEFSITFDIELSTIKYSINPEAIGEYDTSSWEYQHYTRATEWIQSHQPTIVDLARQIVGNTTNPYQQAREVHRWVSDNIRSGPSTGTALGALETRSGGCGDYSSLFVALMRSLGVPARRVGGYMPAPRGELRFTSGEWRAGGLGTHIWSEFLLPGYGWIQCDTTAGGGSFGEIKEHRIILFKGEDIELGYEFPLGTVPHFHMPQQDVMTDSRPPTQTAGEELRLTVTRLD